MTRRLPLFQVDAFASAAFTGNPAAVMPLAAWLSDAEMQAIAAENNLAETAYFVATPDGSADYHLRWFTPEAEIALCGHATLASAWILFTERGFAKTTVRFSTQTAGDLIVTRLAQGRLSLDLPAYPPAPIAVPDAVVAALGGPAPLEAGEHGGYMLLRYANQDQVAALNPDFGALRRTGYEVIATAPGTQHDFISRFFAPCVGVNEDPVTGSAHCRLVPFWADKLGKSALSARQISQRGGDIDCRLDGARVHLAGDCVTVIDGFFRLA
jgi:PhzF family phenazine biosynthesis protein